MTPFIRNNFILITLLVSSIAKAAPVTEIITVNQSINFSVNFPQIAIDLAGNVVITWTNIFVDESIPGSELLTQDGSYSGVFARKISFDGNFLSNEFQVNQTIELSQGGSSIAIEDDGEFIIAWSSLFEPTPYLRKFGVTASAISDEIQAASNSKSPAFTDISIDGSGNYVLTWTSDENINGSPSFHNVFVRKFDSSGTPITNKIRANDTVKWPNVNNRVDTNASGEFIVAWESQTTDPNTIPSLPKNSPDGSAYAIFARKFDSLGVPITPDILVNTTTEGTQSSPDVVINNNGDFIVIWQDAFQTIKQQRFNNIGARVAGEETISLPVSSGTNTPMNPSIDMDATGGYVVSWTTISEPGGNNIVVKQFDNNGTPISEEVSIGTGGSNSEVAVNTDGSFVITWHSLSSEDHIAARFFNSEVIVPFSDNAETASVAANNSGSGSFNWYILSMIALIRLTRPKQSGADNNYF